MKIALFSRGFFNIDYDVLAKASVDVVKEAFADHQLKLFPLAAAPDWHSLEYLRTADLVIVNATNLFPADGRCMLRVPRSLLEDLSVPIVTVGLTLSDQILARTSVYRFVEMLARNAKVHSNRVGVCDEESLRICESYFGADSACLSSYPAVAWSANGFYRRKDKQLLYPPAVEFGPSLADEATSRCAAMVLKQLATKRDSLFTIANEKVSTFYPIGPSVYCREKFPEVELLTLASSSQVVGFDADRALLAAANGAPAVYIHSENALPLSEPVATILAPVTVEMSVSRSTSAMVREIEELLSDYPHSAVQEGLSFEREIFFRFLQQNVSHTLGEFPKQVAPLQARPETDCEPLVVACICSRNYLHSLFGLLQNLLAVHSGPIRAHILKLDNSVDRIATLADDRLSIEFHTEDDIWPEFERSELAGANMRQRAFAGKSRLLRRVLEIENAPVLYTDVDILYFRSPASIRTELAEANLILFPQFNQDYVFDRIFGVFQAGMLMVAPGAEQFLDWWAHMCVFHYGTRVGEDYFVDQGCLDLAPAYFDNVQIHRAGLENVGTWCKRVIGLTINTTSCGQAITKTGKTIGSFHATTIASFQLAPLMLRKQTFDQLAFTFSSDVPKTLRKIGEVAHHGLKYPEIHVSFYVLDLLKRYRRLHRFAERVLLWLCVRSEFRPLLRIADTMLRFLNRQLQFTQSLFRIAPTAIRLIRGKELPPLEREFSRAIQVKSAIASKAKIMFKEDFDASDLPYRKLRFDSLPPKLSSKARKQCLYSEFKNHFNIPRRRKLNGLANRHNGEQCLIVDGNVKLTDEELVFVEQHPNRLGIDGAFQFTQNWKYYACADPGFYESHASEISLVDCPLAFFSTSIAPQNVGDHLTLTTSRYTPFHAFSKELEIFRGFIAFLAGDNSLINLALPLALYMGFEQIVIYSNDELLSLDQYNTYDEDISKLIQAVYTVIARCYPTTEVVSARKNSFFSFASLSDIQGNQFAEIERPRVAANLGA